MGDAIKVTGMVLSSVPVGEYDTRIVILTKERGKIAAFAKGSRRQNSPIMAGTRPFSFGTFCLFEGRRSYTVSSLDISNYFIELSTDLIGAYYGFYFLELAEYYSRENVDETYMIQLLYQSFRALIKETIPNDLVRCIFELKAIEINGEAPQMFQCVMCGKKDYGRFYSTEKRGILCDVCKEHIKDKIELSESAIYTMQYIISSSIEKLYTFVVSGQVKKELSMVINSYIFRYIDKKIKSLEILNSIISQNLN